ncbi:MAG: Shikimate dehydrogenase [Clostridia bacterium 41_269]|nr:MAG: Shikimate dehydrogenase [Clostridia bacterium 41_269]
MNRITSSTRAIGLIGHPIEHSLSPIMQNAAINHCGLDFCYLAFNVLPENLEEAVKGMLSLGFVGFNVTIPYKEAVIKYIDELDENACLIGAVNTVVIKDGKTYGYNTDGKGFLESLKKDGVLYKGKKILIIGAGGAAKAVATALAVEGALKITIANRNLKRAWELAEHIKKIGTESFAVGLNSDEVLRFELRQADIIVNATPVGMYPNTNMIPISDMSCINPEAVVCDLIYNPIQTLFLKTAREMGCKVIDGSGMLLYQGVEAFRLFTGIKPPVEVMYRALHDELWRKV